MLMYKRFISALKYPLEGDDDVTQAKGGDGDDSILNYKQMTAMNWASVSYRIILFCYGTIVILASYFGV